MSRNTILKVERAKKAIYYRRPRHIAAEIIFSLLLISLFFCSFDRRKRLSTCRWVAQWPPSFCEVTPDSPFGRITVPPGDLKIVLDKRQNRVLQDNSRMFPAVGAMLRLLDLVVRSKCLRTPALPTQ